MRSVDEIITLSTSRGGWEGVISRIESRSPERYRVESLSPGDREHGSTIVDGSDIVSGHFNYPDWNIGDEVYLGKHRGVITSIVGNFITVYVEEPRNRDVTFRRFHTVRRWRLLIDNYK